jgi:hypothetical protein
MRIVLLLVLYLGFSLSCWGQNDSIPPVKPKPKGKYTLIKGARQELLTSFLNNDLGTALIWVDSLTGMENEKYASLAWDERWLIYLWEEAYGNLFEGVAAFDDQTRYLNSFKIQPPADSLYEWLDYVMYAQRYEMFGKLSKGFLTEEERVFTSLMIEYLLRLNTDASDWNDRTNAFLKKFPSSRFNAFLKTTQTRVLKPTQSAWNLDILFQSGNWQNELERSFNPLYGIDFGITYSKKRWNYGVHMTIAGTKLARDIEEKTYLWPKKDAANFLAPELEVGYDIVNTKKIRVFPSIGGGLSVLKAPAGTEQNPLPDYYTNFDFRRGYWLGSLTTDIKLRIKHPEALEAPEGSYQGIRLRLGYRKMYLGNINPYLKGDLFFFSVGYNLHVYTSKQ